MSHLCCTKKIIDLLGVMPKQYETEDYTSVLGPWYVNLFMVERKKCLIFVNSRTLFSFIAINQAKKDIKQIGDIFRRNLLIRFRAESIGDDVINKIMGDYEKITLCKTSDKRTLGSMNEFIFHFRVICEMEEGLGNLDIDKFNGELGGMIMKLNGKYVEPRKMLNELIKNSKW